MTAAAPPTAAALLLYAVAALACGCAVATAVSEVSWAVALDAALTAVRDGGPLPPACRGADESLRERARQFPQHHGEVLIADHGAAALFHGESRDMVCLSCVRSRLQSS